MWGSVKNQLRSVIEWTDVSPNAVFEKWSANGDEIKNASKLIVGPGQGCVFVYEGRIQGIHTDQGIVDLRTQNIPFWTTISKVMQGFVSEHKVGLYFFKTTQLVDIKWGTPSVVKYEDPKYKFPVGLRAFGNVSLQIQKPEWFFQQIVGAAELYTTSELRELLNSRIIQPLTDVFAQSHFTYTEIDSHRNELAVTLTTALNQDVDKLGFKLVDFRLEGTSFDEDTMKRINRIADMSAESQAANTAGVSYAQLQQLQALRDAAKNPGGAGMVMGMGVGMGMGQQIGGLAGAVVGGQSDEPVARLKKLSDLLAQGLISQDEFDSKKKEIISKI
jgi:membrane protease subunit (stomatin/prohibitin family)